MHVLWQVYNLWVFKGFWFPKYKRAFLCEAKTEDTSSMSVNIRVGVNSKGQRERISNIGMPNNNCFILAVVVQPPV